ncbi:MAG TPA: hypothetical protein VK806_09900 [Bacteroidia bacterium]|jgi:hypothetical protein|nr:hypothetical protein [Bacteroidia bacterium]
MQKKTTPFLLPQSGTDTSVRHTAAELNGQKLSEPSRQTIENILNYSKALRVESSEITGGFIEYLGN